MDLLIKIIIIDTKLPSASPKDVNPKESFAYSTHIFLLSVFNEKKDPAPKIPPHRKKSEKIKSVITGLSMPEE